MKLPLRRIGLVALLIFSATITRAAFPPGIQRGDGICRFTLHDYPLTRANELTINSIISELRTRQDAAFDLVPQANLRIRIRIFGRFEDYALFASTNHVMTEGHHESSSITNLAGYYSPKNDEVVTWRQRDPSYLANNILHECSHAISRHQFRVLPTWLNEGCAVYFSFPLSLRDNGDKNILNSHWIRLKKMLDENSLPPLREFLNGNTAAFRAMPAERSYPAGWSLFQFLMSAPANREAMNKMIRAIQDQDPEAFDCAGQLEKTFPGGLVRMEKLWHEWIAKGAAAVEAQYRKQAR